MLAECGRDAQDVRDVRGLSFKPACQGGQGQAELHVLQPDGAQQRGPGGALYVSDAQREAGQREVLGMVQRYQQDIGPAEPVHGALVQGCQGQPRAGVVDPGMPRGPRRPGAVPVRHPGQVRGRPPAVRPLDEHKSAVERSRDPDPPGPRQPGLQPMPKQVRVRHVRVPGRGQLRAGGQVHGPVQPCAGRGGLVQGSLLQGHCVPFVGAWAVASSIWRRHRRGNDRA